MLKIGFTGTRHGLSRTQEAALRRFMGLMDRAELHHGDCVGADIVAHSIAGACGWRRVSHPAANVGQLRAYCTSPDVVCPTLPALERNRRIVDDSDALIACPGSMAEEQRSGTWATIRYARKQGVPRRIFWPDGTITGERANPDSPNASRPEQDDGALLPPDEPLNPPPTDAGRGEP